MTSRSCNSMKCIKKRGHFLKSLQYWGGDAIETVKCRYYTAVIYGLEISNGTWMRPTGSPIDFGCRIRRLSADQLLAAVKFAPVRVVGVGVAISAERNSWASMSGTDVWEWRCRFAKQLVCFPTLERSLSGMRGDWLQGVCWPSNSYRCRCFPGEIRGKRFHTMGLLPFFKLSIKYCSFILSIGSIFERHCECYL